MEDLILRALVLGMWRFVLLCACIGFLVLLIVSVPSLEAMLPALGFTILAKKYVNTEMALARHEKKVRAMLG